MAVTYRGSHGSGVVSHNGKQLVDEPVREVLAIDDGAPLRRSENA